jgi:hypothetical protein
VDSSPILRERAILSRAQKHIRDRVTRSTFKVLSADADTAHGLDLSCWIYDELHAAPNRDLYDVLATSTGAREAVTGLAAEAGALQAQRLAGHAKADMSLEYTLGDLTAQDRAVRRFQETVLGLSQIKPEAKQ